MWKHSKTHLALWKRETPASALTSAMLDTQVAELTNHREACSIRTGLAVIGQKIQWEGTRTYKTAGNRAYHKTKLWFLGFLPMPLSMTSRFNISARFPRGKPSVFLKKKTFTRSCRMLHDPQCPLLPSPLNMLDLLMPHVRVWDRISSYLHLAWGKNWKGKKNHTKQSRGKTHLECEKPNV